MNEQMRSGPCVPVHAAVAAELELSSPLDYQVFQRTTKLRGTILVRGHAQVPTGVIEARITGNSITGQLPGKWQRLSQDRNGNFGAPLTTEAGGFYSVEVRVRHNARAIDTLNVPHVGVGEVFVVSGQSNSTNYGETPQGTVTKTVTAFDGNTWRLANDPQPGVQDDSKKGSFIPPFGDAMYRKYGVPIGIASVGHGSTSVRQWLPADDPIELMPTMTKFVTHAPDGTLISDGTLFNGMLERIEQLGPHGFRAVLWHQGESDAHQPPEHDISAETYRRMMERVIVEMRKRAGWNIPWFVALASYHTPDDPSTPQLRDAQISLWTSGIALAGPDTDTLTAAFRQNNGKGTHMNDAGLKAHGALWAQQVELYLDPILH